MKILVAVKRVIDPYAKVGPLADGSGIDTTNVKFDVNPFDEIAIEEAVRQKEKDPSIEIVAVTIGGSECTEQLQKALAMGADRAILVETDQAYDPSSLSKELEAVVRSESPDVILMGKQATDGDNNQVGQMLAARLGWPQATFACNVQFSGGKATVSRETDTGEETLELPLPAVITTDLRLNEPRYIGIAGIVKARSKPIDRRAPVTPGGTRVRSVKVESVPARAAGKKVASVEELMNELSSRGVGA